MDPLAQREANSKGLLRNCLTGVLRIIIFTLKRNNERRGLYGECGKDPCAP